MMNSTSMAALLYAVSLGALAADPGQVAAPVQSESSSSENVTAQTDPSPTTSDAQERVASEASTSDGNRQRAAGARNTDRLDLDTTVVTGNRELPKVLYIVPWKKADIGELPGQPFNTLLDEALMPVDRDVFRREVTYYDAVTGRTDATQSTSAEQR